MYRGMWLFLLSTLLVALPALGRVWYVPSEAATIQAGIDSSLAGDVVEVACGTYYEHDILMKSGIVLRSETGDYDCVTINAQRYGRVLNCIDVCAETVIQGFSITEGDAQESNEFEGWGGGILCHNFYCPSWPQIINCRFFGNTASDGGGIACMGWSSPTFTGCLIQENTGDYGGGMRCEDRAGPELFECKFEDNIAQYHGGAIFCSDFEFASPIANECYFVGNLAQRNGGAIYGHYHPSFTNCLFWANRAEGYYYGSYGGAIYCQDWIILNNCTLVENFADYGGGIAFPNGSLFMDNTIIAFSEQGGATWSNFNIVVDISCNDLYGNVGGDWTGYIDDLLGVDGNISADPLFCGADNGDFTIRSDSRCSPEVHPGCGLIGAFGVGCEPPTGVDGSLANLATTNIGQAFPNPFNPQTTIEFSLAQESRVRLAVYDLLGRKVAILIDDYRPVGPGSVTWNGRDMYGSAVASGVYIARLETADGVQTRKLVVAR